VGWTSIAAVSRSFVGDEVMKDLWYTTEFLDAAEERRNETRDALKELQEQYRWSGGIVPSASWIAERAGQRVHSGVLG
jgi:hypothetical protein